MLHERYYIEKDRQEKLMSRKNEPADFYNGVYTRYKYPVLTRQHIPLTWRYDLDINSNPNFQERLGINAVLNSGAIKLNGKYYLVARIEGNDRKSFFGVAESDNGIDNFRFWDYPILLDDTCKEETNVYDMRLTQHEDGWIYGVFCSESHDDSTNDLSAAVAAAGIVRTKDLKKWERLPNLVTKRSPQQRNVVLHPEFVDGKYAFYTRPMDSFIDTGSGGKPLRRGHVVVGVNDRHVREQLVIRERILNARSLVGDNGEGSYLGACSGGCGDRDEVSLLAHLRERVDPLSDILEAHRHIEEVSLGVLVKYPHDLAGVHSGAAAEGDDNVGLELLHLLRALHRACERRVGSNV